MVAGQVSGDIEAELRGVGSPHKVRTLLRKYEEIGVDQVMFLTPPIRHEDVMESLYLMGKEVLPEFIERDQAAERAKQKKMEPIIEAAMARRPADPVVDPDYEFEAVPVKWNLDQVTEVRDSMKGRELERLKFEELKRAGKIALPDTADVESA
jgi:hypothetical protein